MPLGKYFKIRSKPGANKGLYLEVEGAQPEPGTRVITWKDNREDNQLWYVDHRRGTIRTKLNGMCLDLSGDHVIVNVPQEMPDDVDPNKKWQIKDDHIYGEEIDKVLGIKSNPADLRSEIIASRDAGLPNQTWLFEYSQPKFFYIVSKMQGGLVMDIKGNISAGDGIVMRDMDDKKDSQVWYENKDGNISTKHGHLIMSDNGTIMSIQAPEADSRDKWWLKDGNKVVNRYDDRVLGVQGASSAKDSPVVTAHFQGGTDQLWTFLYL